MNYSFLADMCNVVHIIIIVYWAGGFFVPSRKFPGFVNFHRTFGVVIFATQCIMGFNCPLTLLEQYLRGLVLIMGTAICVIAIIARYKQKRFSMQKYSA